MKGFTDSRLVIFRPSTCRDYAGAKEDGAVYTTEFSMKALRESNEYRLGELESLVKTLCDCFNGELDEFCVGAVNDDGIFYPIDLLIKMAKDGI